METHVEIAYWRPTTTEETAAREGAVVAEAIENRRRDLRTLAAIQERLGMEQ